MALEAGHAVAIQARIRHAVDGVTRRRGEVERIGHSPRLDTLSSAVILSILVPGATNLPVHAARLPPLPTAAEAQVGAPA